MEQFSSGTYIIDSEYHIVNYNETAATLYPMLRKGEKCHKVLMNRERPCEVCPVFHGIKGPKTYLDPIRHLYETVDAVEVPMEDGTTGHALVFSTVGEKDCWKCWKIVEAKRVRVLYQSSSLCAGKAPRGKVFDYWCWGR